MGVPDPISVIICAYSEARLAQIGKAISSVLGQRQPPTELVLVIDHNRSLQEEARSRWPMVSVHASTGPAGLAGARNCGIAVARSPLLAFLDDDAIATAGWTTGLVAAFANDYVQVVGGSARPHWQHGRPRWFPPEFDWVVGCTHSGMPTERGPIRNVVGCNMAFRRAALQVVGGFDTNVGRTATGLLGCEETEICIRIQKHFGAGSVVYDPAIAVDHAVPGDRSRLRYFVRRCLDEGRSKARVARKVGSDAGLADEWTYVRRTLPRAVRASLLTRNGVKSGGVSRALAIVAGLCATVAGYGSERAVLGAPWWRPS